ncbi:MAG: MASE1 domain-containing protein [Gemmatimonadetes bacterium]|nr:MASE1 domain-containing protein [Gemmatimonadota bacterium]
MPRIWRAPLAVAIAYIVACKPALAMAVVNPSASPVWPGTGIAIAALLVFGYRLWPAILIGAFVVNVTTAGTMATSLGIAVGNTLEALVGTWLVDRFAGGRRCLDRTVDILKCVGLISLASALTSPTAGVTTLALARLVPWPSYGHVWVTWWLGNVSGALIVLPVLIYWANNPWVKIGAGVPRLEAIALAVAAVAVPLVVFGDVLPFADGHLPLEFLCTPVFVWAAFRFGRRVTATTIVLVTASAVGGTLNGSGPFSRGSANESLLLLQSFMSVTAVVTLVLAAEIAERRDIESRLRHLAVSDSLTGLANQRQLTLVLDAEITRSQRTGRPFAILFLDLDHLKAINDRYGHLVGSRALVRLAEVLKLSSRAMDTSARFGGDEFALVMPETGEAAARQVAVRVCQRLASDGEEPAVTVSAGVAVYPRDGDTSDGLLRSADRALYASKSGGGGRVSASP